MSRCGIIILAAGGSSRLGRPKQLLSINGETLLGRITRAASVSRASSVTVVLGAHAEECLRVLDIPGMEAVLNPDWREGIASSIRTGVKSLPADVDAVMILLCDQHRVTTELIDAMISQAGPLITASAYGGSLGPPVIFQSKFFPELMALRGDEGAKKIFSSHPGEVVAVPFPEGEMDVDTQEDCERMIS